MVEPVERIALYARVSSPRQTQTQTIEDQFERLRVHVAAHAADGWELANAHVFRDEAASGATLRRPGLDRLRDLVAARAVDRVLVTAPDRLARNYVHQMLLLDEFERHGCVVEFLERPMSTDPHDQLLLQIRGAVAEYERTLIAERMRRGRLRKYQAGLLLPWPRAPYGYRLSLERPRDPAGVTCEPAEAAVVAELFAAYLEEGMTLAQLAKRVQAQGVPSPSGRGCWRAGYLRKLLTNPAYTGHVYAGRYASRDARARWSPLRPLGRPHASWDLRPSAQWIPVATIPALVSPEQFAQVQAKLARNQSFARRHNTAHPYLLRALVSCGRCGLACTGRTASSGRGHLSYYLCNGKAHAVHSGRRERCPSRFIPAQQLDALVWADLCDVLTHPASLTQALERAHGGHWLPQELQARRDQLRQGQQGLARQLDRLTEAYLSAIIPLAEYQRRRTDLEQRQQVLQQHADQIERQAAHHQELAGLLTSVEAFCARVQAGLAQATFEQQRQLVELLIDRVVVTDEQVEIRYVIPTTPASEQVRFCHLRTQYFEADTQGLAIGAGRLAHPPAQVNRLQTVAGLGAHLA
jgi:site-specific DNA recombinase